MASISVVVQRSRKNAAVTLLSRRVANASTSSSKRAAVSGFACAAVTFPLVISLC